MEVICPECWSIGIIDDDFDVRRKFIYLLSLSLSPPSVLRLFLLLFFGVYPLLTQTTFPHLHFLTSHHAHALALALKSIRRL